MSKYKLELKQLVDYPRCRIYREFIRTLMSDRTLHARGEFGLFHFMVLCSYANFRTSYRRLEGVSYTVFPGEWICSLSEITEWFRMRFQHQAISVLEYLQEQQYITYSRHAGSRLIKFKIVDWEKFNTVLEYNAPCQKDTGFFFFPIHKAKELIQTGKCSELDIVLDLWIHAVYNEDQVQGSDVGPVVYFRNCTGEPFVSYKETAERWGVSKSTAGRILNKLAEQDYITLMPCTGRQGSIIYLNNYLSTMFDIADVAIDKDEVAMSLNIHIRIDDELEEEIPNITGEQNATITKGRIPVTKVQVFTIKEEQICVSTEISSVPKSHIIRLVQKLAQTLAVYGVPCFVCQNSIYKLYDYYDCLGKYIYILDISCSLTETRYRFEVNITALDTFGGGDFQPEKPLPTTETEKKVI